MPEARLGWVRDRVELDKIVNQRDETEIEKLGASLRSCSESKWAKEESQA